MPQVIWVTWQQQRRNKGIADAIGAHLHEILFGKPRALRYLRSLMETWKLYSERPDVVICQNPSVVLALFTVLSRNRFGFKVGIDTHNAGLAIDKQSLLLKMIAKYLQRAADFIIVTNEPLKQLVERNGGKAIVVPDKLPDIKPAKPISLGHRTNLLFICTFADDEPYAELFQAASLTAEDIGFYVTGRFEGRVNPDRYPPNVHFLGRLPWDQYDAMLQSVDGIIDLTTREHCLVCGAYEAVAVGKPLVLSDTQALRTYFSKGAVYSANDRVSLARAAQQLLLHKEELTRDVGELKVELERHWEQHRTQLVEAFDY